MLEISSLTAASSSGDTKSSLLSTMRSAKATFMHHGDGLKRIDRANKINWCHSRRFNKKASATIRTITRTTPAKYYLQPGPNRQDYQTHAVPPPPTCCTASLTASSGLTSRRWLVTFLASTRHTMQSMRKLSWIVTSLLKVWMMGAGSARLTKKDDNEETHDDDDDDDDGVERYRRRKGARKNEEERSQTRAR